MLALLGTVVWAGVAVYGIWRMARVLDRFVPVQTAGSATAQANDFAMVPADLVAIAMMESEPWAQDDMMRVIRERYNTFGDWNRVRAAIGVASE
jgi:hypothetical protein